MPSLLSCSLKEKKDRIKQAPFRFTEETQKRSQLSLLNQLIISRTMQANTF